MNIDVTTLEPHVRDRLTTLLVRGGHMSHPLRLKGHIETSASQETILAAIKEKLPAHLVPDQITTSAALPRLANGKLDRNGAIRSEPEQVLAIDPPEKGSETLEILREIWIDLLGSEEIYDEDNFVEMGGDSLLSISVVSRARAAGLEILPSDLFDYKNLLELSQRVSLSAEKQSLSTVSEGPLNLSSAGDDTSDQPIFLLNANRKMLDHLNDQLNPRRTLHLITMHWDSGQISGHETIGSIADDFLARMRKIQPEGPYSVGGFSIGAVAAHEIARTLVKEGIEISDLILIDPPENPDLFASAYNKDHEFTGGRAEVMTFPRRLRNKVVLAVCGVFQRLGLPIPRKLNRRFAVAAYFRAAKSYQIQEPAVAPIIVSRSKQAQPTSMWAHPTFLRVIHSVGYTHREFHLEETAIKEWTGLLAKTLDDR